MSVRAVEVAFKNLRLLGFFKKHKKTQKFRFLGFCF